MKEKKKEDAREQPASNKNKTNAQKKSANTTPISSEQIAQNFRQNSGNNVKDAGMAPDGLSDYR